VFRWDDVIAAVKPKRSQIDVSPEESSVLRVITNPNSNSVQEGTKATKNAKKTLNLGAFCDPLINAMRERSPRVGHDPGFSS
jgi:hypothetical protein